MLVTSKVLQGGEARLTEDNLLTIDPDTPPSDLVYTVLSGPSNGRLVRQRTTTTAATTTTTATATATNTTDTYRDVKTFTQQEVTEGALVFLQNGTRKSGSMYFKVTDGQFPAFYKVLDIFVIPVLIDTSRLRPVELVQSESSVYLSRRFLNVSTNGDRDDLHYEVAVKPKHGRLLLRGKEVDHFGQRDVDTDSVLYVMHNFSHSQDSFRCRLRMEGMEVAVEGQTIRIVVKPLIKQVPLVAPAGATVSITKANLDASELAARTGDDPAFEITAPPRHGLILRKLRKRRGLIAQPVLKPVETFTFEDVVYAKIFYVSNASSGDGPPIADSFSYILRANNAQPAAGKFLVNLDEAEADLDGDDDDGGGGTLGSDDESLDAEVSGSKSGDEEDSDDMMIIGVVLGVLLVLALAVVVVVVVVVWRRRRSEGERYRESSRARSKPRPYISGPLQLEQPHVHIEPQQCLPSPGGGEGADEERCLMRHSANLSAFPAVNLTHDPHHPSSTATSPRSPDLSRAEVSSAVPDCKVTPLVEVKGEGEGSEPEPGAAGDRQSGRSSASADLYDWTLMDPELLQHCRTEKPVLRENQYWV